MKDLTNKLINPETGKYETLDQELNDLAAITEKKNYDEINLRSAFFYRWEEGGGIVEETILPPEWKPKVKTYLAPSWEKQVLSAPDPVQTPIFKRTEAQIEKLERMKIMGVQAYTHKEHALWNRGKYHESKQFRNEITKSGKVQYRKATTKRAEIENKLAETFNELLKVVMSDEEVIIIPLFKLLQDERVKEIIKRRKVLNKLARSIGKDEFILESEKKQLDPSSDNYDPREYLVKLLIGFGIFAEAKRYTPEEEKENTSQRKRLSSLWEKAKDPDVGNLYHNRKRDFERSSQTGWYNFNSFITQLYETNAAVPPFLNSKMQSAAKYWSNLDKGRYLVLHNSCQLETFVNPLLPQSMEVQL